MRIRVLHLLTALGYGGAEMWLLKLVEPLKQMGIDVAFGLKAPERGPPGFAPTARTYEVRLDAAHIAYVRKVVDIVERERFDVVHTHEFVYSAVGVIAAKRAHVPSVLTLHSFEFPPQTRLTRLVGIRNARALYCRLSLGYALRHVDVATAFSRAVFQRVAPGYDGDPRFRILRHAANPPELASEGDRAAFRESQGWSATTPVIIHVGRFADEKNHAGLLRIFRLVLREVDDARLLLVGTGILEDSIREQARDLLSAGKVRFLGTRDDVPRLLSLSDVMAFPSFNEGFGLVALEANGAGIPVVGSDIPALDEAVVNDETAILRRVDDEVGMARALGALLRDHEKASAMGMAGRKRVQECFSVHRSAEILAEIYRELVKNKERQGVTP